MRPRPTTSPEAEIYRDLITPASPTSAGFGWLKRTGVSLALITLAGVIWRWNEYQKNEKASTSPGDAP